MGVAGPPAENRGGRILGTVREILRAGGGEVAVVDGPGGEPLVPLVRAFVPRFAPRRGVMVVDTRRLGLDDGAARAGPATDVRNARGARNPRAGGGAGPPCAPPPAAAGGSGATAASTTTPSGEGRGW